MDPVQITTEQAIQMQNNYISYCASKKAGEQAIWEFMEKEQPKFHVTVFLPPLIFGPPIHKVNSLKHINYSNDVFYSLWNGTYAEVPPTSFPAYVRSRPQYLCLHCFLTPRHPDRRPRSRRSAPQSSDRRES